MQSRGKYPSRIYGQTCSPVDDVLNNVVLPDLKIGERVLWTNMGAYTAGFRSTFCGVPPLVSRYIFKEDHR